ncbi:imidazolonepropionase [Acidocella sp.]|uniref:imidazolonepropionase n=1 Tax=Acidocella sp. TaxID=50710 RepID=UPI00262D4CDF|nr:imidazolonepropionase [Acidocella sp.]
MQADRIFTNARLATMDPALPGLGVVARGMVAERAGRIVYAGPMVEMAAREVRDCAGRWVTPGLIDCHTHLVYAGNRAGEFEARLEGARYAEIAAKGGGIAATVAATRAAGEAELATLARARLDTLMAEGVTTVEVKSGYGLEPAAEYKCLRVARRLGDACDVAVTFLGAHALPPGVERHAYVRALCEEMIPFVAAQRLADAVDGFCETVAFSPAEIRQVFEAAQRHGLRVKLHADQLSDLGGAALAAAFGALSADHIEYTSEDGVAALAASGTVAVLLPGAFYALKETRLPPIAALRARGVPMAVSTDHNPGTSPLYSLPLAMNMAAVQFGLTVPECWLGVTRNAARALGRGDVGVLRAGAKCHLAIWNIENLAEPIYQMGGRLLHERVWSGP